MSAAMREAGGSSWKARRKKAKKRKPRRTSEPEDEASEVMRFAHEPIRARIAALRKTDAKPNQAARIAADLCDLCAWNDAVWFGAVRPWLRASDKSKFDADLGFEVKGVRATRQGPTNVGSTYRYLCAITEQEICEPLRVLQSEAPLSQKHRARLALRDGLAEWAANSEAALAAFRTLVSRWFRSQQLDESLSETLFFMFAERAGHFESWYDLCRRAKVVQSDETQADETTSGEDDEDVAVKDLNIQERSAVLMKVLAPGLASLEQWLGPERSHALFEHGHGERKPLSRIARACAERRTKYVAQLDAGHHVETHETDDFENESCVSIGFYGETMKVPLITVALLGQPSLLRRAFTSHASDALELMEIAGVSRNSSETAASARIVARATPDEDLADILEGIASALDQISGKDGACVETRRSLSLDDRTDAILTVLGRMLPVACDIKSVLDPLRSDVSALLDEFTTPSKLASKLRALEKEASLLNVGTLIEESSKLPPADVACACRLLGRAAKSDEASCKAVNELAVVLPRLLSSNDSSRRTFEERLNANISRISSKLPPGIDRELALKALLPSIVDAQCRRHTPLLVQALEAVRSCVLRVQRLDEASDATSDSVLEPAAQLVLLESWIRSQPALSNLFDRDPRRVLECLAAQLLHLANHLNAPKSVLWAPLVVESIAIRVLETPDSVLDLDGAPVQGAYEIGTALLDFSCLASNSTFVAEPTSNVRAIVLKADRIVRSWVCRALQCDAARSKPIEQVHGAVGAALLAASKQWRDRRESATRCGALAAASLRAYEQADLDCQNQMAMLRVRRFIEARRAQANDAQATTSLLRRATIAVQQTRQEGDLEHALKILHDAVANGTTDEEAAMLLMEAANAIQDDPADAQKLLESAATWIVAHDKMGSVVKAAIEKLSSGNVADAARLLEVGADSFASQRTPITLASAAKKLAENPNDATVSYLRDAAAALTSRDIARLLREAAYLVEHSEANSIAAAFLNQSVYWTYGSDFIGPSLERAAALMAKGDRVAAIESLTKAIDGLPNAPSIAEAVLEVEHYLRRSSSDGHARPPSAEPPEEEDEYNVRDRLVAACLAEETKRALAAASTEQDTPTSQIRVDALVSSAVVVGLPRPTALEAAAMGVRFGRAWSIWRRAADGNVDQATTSLIVGDTTSDAQERDLWCNASASTEARVASLLGESTGYCSGVWCEMRKVLGVSSNESLDVEAMTVSIGDAALAIRLGAFDVAGRHETKAACTNVQHPRRTPGPPLDDATCRSYFAAETTAESGGTAVNDLRNDDAAATKSDLLLALEQRGNNTFGGSTAFVEALANWLPSLKYERVSQGTAPKGSENCSAFVLAAKQVGFRDASPRCANNETPRAGYGLLESFRAADPARSGAVSLETFVEVLASPAGGSLVMSGGLTRAIYERFRSRKGEMQYDQFVEWLVPRGTVLQFRIIATSHAAGCVRLQFCVDAWLTLCELRSRVSRRLFWEAHRDGVDLARACLASLDSALFTCTHADQYETAAAQMAAAVASESSLARQSNSHLSTSASKHHQSVLAAASAAAAAAVADYKRAALIGDEFSAMPVFFAFAHEESIYYVGRQAAPVHITPQPQKKPRALAVLKEKLESRPLTALSIQPVAKRTRKPTCEAHNWTPQELACYFRELEFPEPTVKAVLQDPGVPGSVVVFGSTASCAARLDLEALSDTHRARVWRHLRTLRATVLNAAWHHRNARQPHKWAPSVVAAFLLRSGLDSGDGVLLRAFHTAGIDGHELFGVGERGVVHDSVLCQISIDDPKLRCRIRQAAVKERLETLRHFEDVPQSSPPPPRRVVKRRSKSPTKPSRAAPEPTKPSRAAPEPTPPRRDTKKKQPSRRVDRAPPLELLEIGGDAVDLFSAASIQVPSLESLRRVQDSGSKLITRGFLDTSWIQDFADTPSAAVREVLRPMMTPADVFAAFASQLEVDARNLQADEGAIW